MKHANTVTSISRLIELRDVEVDRLTSDVAKKEAIRQRFHHNLDRMARLCQESAATGSLPMALSVNCANYKQAVLNLMAEHQRDLALHEADMAVAQQALMAVSLKREVLDRVRDKQSQRVREEQARRDQKQQDEQASIAWFRQRV